jgi:hypothetical protein
MENSQQRYEVYIERTPKAAGFDPAAAKWSWCKLSLAGLVLVHGSRHYSLEACFAAVRKHRSTFGDAPITINLRQGGQGDPPPSLAVPVIDRHATPPPPRP